MKNQKIKFTEKEFRKIFPRATETIIRLNCDPDRDSGVSDKSEQMDREKVFKTQRSQKMGTKYRLISCEILYWCGHGKLLDPSDNQSYAAIKPIADALVNIGAASDDKDFKATAAQRLNKDEVNF